MKAQFEPQFAPPGAGLPAVELAFARILFAARRLTGNRDSFNARFQQERTRIQQLLPSLDHETAAQRVLIPHLRGLEDSSRYWSVWMTLDHLRIVHQQIARVIQALTDGIPPKTKASTAKVKPSPDANASTLSEFQRSCEQLLDTVAKVPDLNTKLRYAHPWFGPLNAAGWHALASGHLAIHKAQLQRIVSRLK